MFNSYFTYRLAVRSSVVNFQRHGLTSKRQREESQKQGYMPTVVSTRARGPWKARNSRWSGHALKSLKSRRAGQSRHSRRSSDGVDAEDVTLGVGLA